MPADNEERVSGGKVTRILDESWKDSDGGTDSKGKVLLSAPGVSALSPALAVGGRVLCHQLIVAEAKWS